MLLQFGLTAELTKDDRKNNCQHEGIVKETRILNPAKKRLTQNTKNQLDKISQGQHVNSP